MLILRCAEKYGRGKGWERSSEGVLWMEKGGGCGFRV